MPLGFDPALTLRNPVDTDFREFMSSSLQQLGKQVQDSVKQIVTNRQLRQMGDELKQVDPKTPYFPQELVGIMSRYPLAAFDRRGTAALTVMSNAHKSWSGEQARAGAPYSSIAGGRGVLDRRTGKVTGVPESMLPKKSPVRIQNKNGAILADPDTGKEVARFGDPFLKEPNTAEVNQLNRARNVLRGQYNAALKQAYDADIAANRGADAKGTKFTDAEANSVRAKATSFANEANRLKQQLDELDRAISERLKTITPATGDFEETTVEDLGMPDGEEVEETTEVNALIPEQPTPDQNEKVKVIAPDGKRGVIPKSQVEAATRQGYRLQ